MSDLFTPEEDDGEPAVYADNRCTPETLLAFLLARPTSPTLAELKAEFGGVLRVLAAAWELQRQGKYPIRRPQ